MTWRYGFSLNMLFDFRVNGMSDEVCWIVDNHRDDVPEGDTMIQFD